MLIADVMDRKAARIHRDSPMALAAELLVLSQASDLAVIDEQGSFLGVLSEGDLLRALMPDVGEDVESPASLRRAFANFLDAGPAYADQPIGRLVIHSSITLRSDDELLKAATVMVDRQIRRLPVVDDGRFVGSVSRADICWGLLVEGTGGANGVHGTR
jgi:CBS domain-containing protein